MFYSFYVAVFIAVFLVKDSESVVSTTCHATGDPHYKTFDGKTYNFMGTCQYVLAKDVDNKFVILQENVACNGRASCTKSLTVIVKGLHISVGRNAAVTVNGVTYTKQTINFPGVQISVSQGRIVKIKTDIELSVQFDGMNVYVTLSDQYRGKTKGLCGNFNGDKNDDFRTRSNTLVYDANTFANSWKVSQSCPNPPKPGPSPCIINQEMAEFAKSECKLLLQKPFTKCHRLINPNGGAIQDCEYDVCASKDNPIASLCQEFAAYAEECALVGLSLDWKKEPHFAQCAQPCSFAPCMNGGYCFNEVNDHRCECRVGYRGKNCENKI